MPIRTNTVEYSFNFITSSIAAGASGSHEPLVIHIPESGSHRTFRSVVVQTYFQQSAATPVSPSAMGGSIQFTGPALSPISTGITSSTLANSGETMTLMCQRDVTGFFQAYFSSSFNHVTCSLTSQLTQATQPYTNIASKIIITYSYEELSSSILLKTVRIPLEGKTGNLTTALTAVDHIPALATYLPEANKNFRDLFFEIEVQNNTTATAAPDPQLNLSLDAEAAWGDGAPNDALRSAVYYYRILKRPDMNVSSSHVLSASTTNTNTPFPCLTAVLHATYEYDAKETTSVFNSLMIPIFDETGCIGGNTPALQTRYRRSFPIVDEGPIKVMSSSFKAWLSDGGAIDLRTAFNSQSYQTYNWAASVRAGSLVMQRRIDDQLGPLQRGLNEFTFDAYRTGTTNKSLGSNLSGMLYLNYTSSVNPEGIGSNSKTIITHHSAFTNNTIPQLIIYSSSVNQPYMPEDYFYLISGGGLFYANATSTGTATQWVSWQTQVRPEEEQGSGWVGLYNGTVLSDAEAGIQPFAAFAADVWRRYPGDPAVGRVSYRKDRNFRWSWGPATFQRIVGNNITTYHSRQFTKTGSIYPNPGSGHTVYVYRDDTHELAMTASTDANGQYVVDFHNDTIDLYSEVKVSDTQMGRSGMFRVTGSAFNPLSLSNNTLALSDDYISSLWTDDSVTSTNLTQSVGASVPTVGTLSGHTAPVFDGSNDYLENLTSGQFETIVGPDKFEFWVVFDVSSVSSEPGTYYDNAALFTDSGGWCALAASSTNFQFGYNNGSGDFIATDTVALLGTGTHVARCRIANDNTVRLRIDDRAEVSSTAMSAFRTWVTEGIRIGSNYGPGAYISGSCHLWAFEGTLNGWDVRSMYRYLQQRYGVTIPT